MRPTHDTMAARNKFKLGLASPSGPPLTICWLSLASDTAAELLSQAGFAACLIDAEHAPNDLDLIRRQIMAVELRGQSSVIARTPINEPWVIKRLMDAGAQTILVPMVDTAEQAAAAAAALRFPPDGTRGVAGASRAAGFGGYREGYLTTANAEACCIVQIESTAGVANIEAIAAVPGVDALFLGPSDLAASLGHLGRPDAPEVLEVLEGAVRRIVAAGKPCGIFAFRPERARRFVELGARFVAVGSDVSLLVAGAKALAAEFAPKPPV